MTHFVQMFLEGAEGFWFLQNHIHQQQRQLIKLNILVNILIIITELNLRKKWLVVLGYKPPAQDATYFFNCYLNLLTFKI